MSCNFFSTNRALTVIFNRAACQETRDRSDLGRSEEVSPRASAVKCPGLKPGLYAK